MGLFFKNVNYPDYGDYKPEYWNDAIRWALCQPEKPLTLVKAKSTSKKKTTKTAAKGTLSKSSTKTAVDAKKTEPVTNIIPITEEPQPSKTLPQKIEVNVPKNGSELIFLPKDCLLTKQLQDESPMPSGEVIEIRTTLEDRIVSLAIGYNADTSRWLIIYFDDNKAPAKEVKKTKKTASKSKSKSKSKSSSKAVK